MNELSVVGEDEALFRKVSGLLDEARARVARTVNTAMVEAYWRIGREIVEVEQRGKDRADYGDAVVSRLSVRLRATGMKGAGVYNLKAMRRFFLAFPDGTHIHERKSLKSEPNIGRTPSAQFHPALSWSHYLRLASVVNPLARSFYEIEAAREAWSISQLERQINSKLFERLAAKGNAAALGNNGQNVSGPKDVLKDPFVLEFLELRENPADHERGLEQRIIDRIESFMLELGKGFSFVARQRRITLEGDHFYVDLVFYNRLLRCFVLIDLKLGKLAHADLGQMQMYVNWFDEFQRLPEESRTIGIVLCSEKNEAMVRITLPSDPAVLAARYAEFLPTEAELLERVTKDREDAERALRLRESANDESHERGAKKKKRSEPATEPAPRTSITAQPPRSRRR